MKTHDYETDAEALPCDDCDTPDGARWDTWDGRAVCDLCFSVQRSPSFLAVATCVKCDDPAEAAAWTPVQGWINLCTRHHTQVSRDVVANIIEKATR